MRLDPVRGLETEKRPGSVSGRLSVPAGSGYFLRCFSAYSLGESPKCSRKHLVK